MHSDLESLGRGLESLIPEKQPEEIPAGLNSEKDLPQREVPQATQTSSAPNGNGARSYQDHFVPRRGESIFWIEVEKIHPNPYQPRREFNQAALLDLSHSIREHGVLQPILVSKRDIETPTGLDVKYELIAGERRLRAAKLAGLSQIPAVIRRGMPDDRVRLELALIENVQREDLNPMEKARAFKQLIDEFHMVQREIASRVGKSREVVANTLRLMSLPSVVQTALSEGRLTEGHARAVLMVGDESAKQVEIFNSIMEEHLNVRESENRARQMSGKIFTPRKRPSMAHDPITKEWQNRLQERLGTRVVLQRLGDRGRIVVEFFSEEELKGILDKLIREA